MPKAESNSRKVITKILTKKLKDGSFIPMEITRTVIHRDGSRETTKKDC